jgi:hypothetical protein
MNMDGQSPSLRKLSLPVTSRDASIHIRVSGYLLVKDCIKSLDGTT